MPQKTWSDELLDKKKMIGDPPVDKLVEELLAKVHSAEGDSQSFGRLGYNSLLNLTDTLLKSPELVFATGSNLSEQMAKIPPEFTSYFMPEAVPDWVDPDKIKLGASLWTKWTLPIFNVLFMKSLPTCYLMRNGIAALYETSKLRDQKYITQRMYETALFIEAVMRGEGGIEILSDIRPAFDENLASAVNNVDPQGGWHWEGRRLVRTDEKISDFAGDEMQKISEQLESLEKESKPGRYFWGAGYITAKKVRFLHASMRYMLQFPERFPMLQKARPKDGKFDSLAEAHGSSLKPWDVKNKGIPINQEQEAFALLTFSYTIVEGLDKWGCGLTREEEVAYLHLWKVVGYLMGVQEELLSDQPDECRSLMKKILEREGASTENGYIMTQALINWLKDYLPPTLGMDEYLSPYLMKWQMGDQAALVIPAKEMAKTNVLWRKTIFYGVINFLRGYNRINSYLMRRHGGAPSPMFKMIYESTLLIIHSLRSAYERRPYYVPVNPTQWMRSYGATPAFMQRLLIWRRSMFNTLGFGVGLAIFARCLFVATVGLAIFDCWRETVLAGVAGLLAYFLSHAVLYRKLPGTYESRPKLSEQDLIISETESRTESNV